MAETRYCFSCGQALKGASRFCGKCGAEARSNPAKEAACPSCGVRIEDASDQFCSACGSALPALSDLACTACGLPMEAEFKHCPACGAAFAPPQPDLASRPTPAPSRAPKPASTPRAASGHRAALLALGGVLLVAGLGLLGFGAMGQLKKSGVVGGFQTSPSSLSDLKADVWEDIRQRQKAEQAEIASKAGASE